LAPARRESEERDRKRLDESPIERERGRERERTVSPRRSPRGKNGERKKFWDEIELVGSH